MRAVASQWVSPIEAITAPRLGRKMATMKMPSNRCGTRGDGVDQPHEDAVGPAAERGRDARRRVTPITVDTARRRGRR